jgi:hypothetical protein
LGHLGSLRFRLYVGGRLGIQSRIRSHEYSSSSSYRNRTGAEELLPSGGVSLYYRGHLQAINDLFTLPIFCFVNGRYSTGTVTEQWLQLGPVQYMLCQPQPQSILSLTWASPDDGQGSPNIKLAAMSAPTFSSWVAFPDVT